MAFYTGDRFPDWKNNVLVGALLGGAVQGVGHLERIIFDTNWDETGRQSLLTDIKQRIRDVRQGPDGLVYVLSDEDNGALLRLEPRNSVVTAAVHALDGAKGRLPIGRRLTICPTAFQVRNHPYRSQHLQPKMNETFFNRPPVSLVIG